MKPLALRLAVFCVSFGLFLVSNFLKQVSVSFVVSSRDANEDFMECMSAQLGSNFSITPLEIICPFNSCNDYSRLLLSSEQNLRWVNTPTSKPLYIITPSHEWQIQASVVCSRSHGLQIRVRSGGHDYEGLSYRCDTPFVLIDLANFHSIEINIEEETALVQSGATLGELYNEIAKKSGTHGFPGGICPSVGVGGHFSGGGLGTLVRKYGLAADHIIDASMIDANGKILDRRLMGEDLFWAIRGGAPASFGVILSWKVKLVKVPATVAVFTVSKSLDDPSSMSLVQKWQDVGNKLPEDLFIMPIVRTVQNKSEVLFRSLFLGQARDLIQVMDRGFPELGLRAENCTEMSWIESDRYHAGYKVGDPPEMFLDRVMRYRSSFKAKCDFVKEPMPEIGLQRIWEMIREEKLALIIMVPLGGRMSEISESEIPFPHRKGYLYEMQYMVKWYQGDDSEKHLEWMRRLYEDMTPYVSKSPRAAYVNYRDLDLGMNKGANASYQQARVWGEKYFQGNFKRLVRVKTMVDPENFFRNEQSIPTDSV